MACREGLRQESSVGDFLIAKIDGDFLQMLLGAIRKGSGEIHGFTIGDGVFFVKSKVAQKTRIFRVVLDGFLEHFRPISQ